MIIAKLYIIHVNKYMQVNTAPNFNFIQTVFNTELIDQLCRPKHITCSGIISDKTLLR